MVDNRVNALRSVRATGVAAGRRDSYCLDLGAQAFSSRLTAHGERVSSRRVLNQVTRWWASVGGVVRL